MQNHRVVCQQPNSCVTEFLQGSHIFQKTQFKDF